MIEKKRDFEDLTDIEKAELENGSKPSRPHHTSTLHKFISVIAFCWSLFQVWVASPLQFKVATVIGSNLILLNDAQIRSVHLAFGIFIVFLISPAFRNSPTKYVPFNDWLFAIFAACSSLYVGVFYNNIALRLGIPNDWDITFAIIGIALLLEAARRTVGTAIAIIGVLFLLYSYFGEIMPYIIIHKDYSISSIISHQWLSSEGVFGTALGVSADFVFLYVLFGALLEKTGAGNFFIQLSFALLGRFKGGPAKAAVVSSGLMGMISGSSIANTITVGSLTIPLMKKMGFSAEKAAAIEVSAGVNGQIMPPVMGAAAFLIAEYLSIPYTEIIKHAFLPAILIYIALLYIVHIEACKISLSPDNTPRQGSLFLGTLRFLLSALGFIIAGGAVYFAIEGFDQFIGIKALLGKNSIYIMGLIIFTAYVALLKYQASQLKKAKKELFFKDENILSEKVDHVEDIGTDLGAWVVLKCGFHHFLPILILIWCLLIEHMSPALSAYWTILFLVFELFTKKIIINILYGRYQMAAALKEGFEEFINAMIMGAKNMTVVAIATATAGIIVGSISLTGIGQKISGILDYVANGNFFITLFLTAMICIILGMGMPTTACYIVVANLMVPVLKYITEKNAIYVPPLALHLFVFYFGLMADVTPPVGLASYAGAAIAGANAISTGIQAFSYNIRTMLIPFLFIYNPEILAYGISSWPQLAIVVIFSIIGIIVITGGTQNYFVTKSKWYESILLFTLGIAFICPQIPIDIISPAFKKVVMERNVLLENNPSNRLKFTSTAPNFFGKEERRDTIIEVQPFLTINEQLQECGLLARYDDELGNIRLEEIDSKKATRCAALDNSAKIIQLKIGKEQMSRIYIYIVSAMLLVAVIFLQRKRVSQTLEFNNHKAKTILTT